MELVLYGIYLFLAIYLVGNMTTLQIQHYGIYDFVGKNDFKSYMKANNQSAAIPSILPAMLLLIVNIALFFVRPAFMPVESVIASLLLNVISLASTFRWQRKIQGEMAIEGYDKGKLNRLLSTNWIRVIAFLMQALMAVTITLFALK